MTAGRDSGFTVVELLLSMAILMIIIGTISSALIVFFNNGSYAIARDDHSAGAQILASYLDRDLASAESGTVAAPSAPCSAGTKDLLLRWDEWTAGPTSVTPVPGDAYSAAYDLLADGHGGYRLERWYCKGTTAVSHSVLVERLASADFTAAAGSGCGAGSTSLVVTLGAYAEDTLSDYAYAGCLRGRLG